VARETAGLTRGGYSPLNPRALIDEFTKDSGRAPPRLGELVEKHFLCRLPTDPFTGSNETWGETVSGTFSGKKG
jgi:hypothetical protein